MSTKVFAQCHRFPLENISDSIWLYNSFSRRYRDIEKMIGLSRDVRYLKSDWLV